MALSGALELGDPSPSPPSLPSPSLFLPQVDDNFDRELEDAGDLAVGGLASGTSSMVHRHRAWLDRCIFMVFAELYKER